MLKLKKLEIRDLNVSEKAEQVYNNSDLAVYSNLDGAEFFVIAGTPQTENIITRGTMQDVSQCLEAFGEIGEEDEK